MSMQHYVRQHGKLTERYTLVVDARFKDLAKLADDRGFDFQGWARDQIYPRLGELEDFLRSSAAASRSA